MNETCNSAVWSRKQKKAAEKVKHKKVMFASHRIQVLALQTLILLPSPPPTQKK
jgi:hypothetical protein